MVRKIIATLIDDIDGDEASERVKFGLDGVEYEIDLHARHAENLRASFADYVAAGRRTGGRLDGRSTRSTRQVDPRTVRKWALEQGLTVSEQGRIPGPIMSAYMEANPGSQSSSPAASPARTTTPPAPTGPASPPRTVLAP